MKGIVDKFEYKGKEITVQKINNDYFFKWKEENGKEVSLSMKTMKEFIDGSFSHTTINTNIVDVIEKSIKINDFIYNLEDLKNRIKKYS